MIGVVWKSCMIIGKGKENGRWRWWVGNGAKGVDSWNLSLHEVLDDVIPELFEGFLKSYKEKNGVGSHHLDFLSRKSNTPSFNPHPSSIHSYLHLWKIMSLSLDSTRPSIHSPPLHPQYSSMTCWVEFETMSHGSIPSLSKIMWENVELLGNRFISTIRDTTT